MPTVDDLASSDEEVVDQDAKVKAVVAAPKYNNDLKTTDHRF